ncbi:twin-arginine translocation signal domain-containing protein, partial [Mycobacterium sp. 852013-50091_SCH5140682]
MEVSRRDVLRYATVASALVGLSAASACAGTPPASP